MNIQKLTQKSQEALRNAQTYAQNNNNQMIEPCHIALALVSDSDGLIPSVISKCAGNRTAIIKELTSMISSLPKVKMQSSDNSQIYVSQDTEKVLNIAESAATVWDKAPSPRGRHSTPARQAPRKHKPSVPAGHNAAHETPPAFPHRTPPPPPAASRPSPDRRGDTVNPLRT